MDGIMYAKAAACVSAALVVGIGVLGPAIAQGLVAGKAVENLGKYPESAGKIRTAMMLGMGIIETAGIFSTLIGGALIYLAMTL